MSVVVLVEGDSDRNAVITLANRLGRDLDDEGVDVVAMGGAAAFREYIERFDDQTILGLCDEGEVPDLIRALDSPHASDADLVAAGFFVCVRDLEEELIRANGVETVLQVFEDEGESRVFRKFQLQPEWRGRPIEDQLRRFLGTRAGRKVRFGGLLAASVDLDRIPQPLRGLLDSF